MSELAAQLIEENLRTKAPVLDLGNCGLDGTEKVLERLGECGHLETLIFSNIWWEYDQTKARYINHRSQNNGKKNKLFHIPSGLPKKMRKLVIAGHWDHPWVIINLALISRLTNLIHLNVSFNGFTDVTPLVGLTELTYLDISESGLVNLPSLNRLTKLVHLNISGSKLVDLAAIAELPGLTSLYADFNQLTDLTPLAALTKLTQLNIGNNQITELTSLVALTGLVHIGLSGNKLIDLAPLAGLSKLTSLDISSNKLNNLVPIANLNRLEYLDISSNTIFDAMPLKSLTNLKVLTLSGNIISDLQPFQKLKKLKTLVLSGNNISNISPLKELNNLRILYLGHNKIKELSSIQQLTKLTKLRLGDNQLHSNGLHLLGNLNNLTELGLENNKLDRLDWNLVKILPYLKIMKLYGNAIRNVPLEIFNQPTSLNDGNCLPILCDYFTDLAQGKTKVHQTKIILIGNGRTGKTCLVKRWLDDTFDKNEASTHAIQLRSHFLPELAKAKELDYVQLNVWDFGGQDIYHSTHRLFMQTQAVFVLVWDAKTEQRAYQEEVLEDGSTVTYQNHSLAYWLNYAKVLGNNSPVLVVQTKTALHGEKSPENWQELKKQYNIVAAVSVDSALSNEDENGFSDLKHYLYKTIRQQIDKACTDLPTSWWKVQQAIEQLQAASQKTLSLEQFSRICEKQLLNENSQTTLRDYLHSTGFFFYRPKLFNNEIIIDQKWAIDAVYTLFDRKGMFMKYQGKGFFKGEDLQLSWQDKSQNEQELLVSFMESCKICVEVSHHWVDVFINLPFKEREYLAPQLLPDKLIPNQAEIFPKGAKGIYIKIKHPFLHAGIMQSFIVSRAAYAQRDNIKQQRIYFETFGQKVLAEAFPAQNEIIVRLPPGNIKQKDLAKIIAQIRIELSSIDESIATSIEEMVSIDGQGYISWQALQNHPPNNPQIVADNGMFYDSGEFTVFLEKPTTSNPADITKLQACVQQALKCIEEADFAGYFKILDNIVPSEEKHQFNFLKKQLIIEGIKVDYADKLRVFAKSLIT